MPKRPFDPALHDTKCAYRVGSLGAVAIECEHGYDACPTCDPCTCAPIAPNDDKGGTKNAD